MQKAERCGAILLLLISASVIEQSVGDKPVSSYSGGGPINSVPISSGSPTLKPISYPSSQPYYKPSFPSYTTTTAHKKETKQNCTVVDEVMRAEICTPGVETECLDEVIMSSKITEEQSCFDVGMIQCEQTTDSVETEVCTYIYESKNITEKVSTIDVNFRKSCSSQMVTVCQPEQSGFYGYNQQSSYGGGSSYGRGQGALCKEIKQNTCYNEPIVSAAEEDFNFMVPEPRKACQTKVISLPKVDCQVMTTQKCITLPKIEPEKTTVQKCVAKVGQPRCREVELILPKQICQDIIYGYAQKYSPVNSYSTYPTEK